MGWGSVSLRRSLLKVYVWAGGVALWLEPFPGRPWLAWAGFHEGGGGGPGPTQTHCIRIWGGRWRKWRVFPESSVRGLQGSCGIGIRIPGGELFTVPAQGTGTQYSETSTTVRVLAVTQPLLALPHSRAVGAGGNKGIGSPRSPRTRAETPK
jgi:hypothetical protein